MKRLISALVALLLLCGCAAAPSVGIIGGADGPTAIYVSTPGNATPEPPKEEPAENPTPAEPSTPVQPDDAMAHFGVQLLRQVSEPGKNCLISPLSAHLALSMAAEGAANDTLKQMESTLGMDVASLRTAAREMMQSLEDGSPLHLANAVWFRDDPELTVEDAFLTRCAGDYDAKAQQVPFDSQTLAEVNQWVSDQTHDMIPTLYEQWPSDDIMLLLVNALAFDAAWASPYGENDIQDSVFTTESGVVQNVEMMSSSEDFYLDDGQATGFVKPYEDGRYGFAALLPNEGISVADYLAGLTGEGLRDTLSNALRAEVNAAMPAFTTDSSVILNDALCAMGMTDAFNPEKADLSAMGRYGAATAGSDAAGESNLFIGSVLQKTFIEVNAQGTRAAAVTAITVDCLAALRPQTPKSVILDRPFVYLIVDLETNQPLFLGVMMDMQ